MRKDAFGGFLFFEAARAVRLEHDMFPMLKYINEDFMEK